MRNVGSLLLFAAVLVAVAAPEPAMVYVIKATLRPNETRVVMDKTFHNRVHRECTFGLGREDEFQIECGEEFIPASGNLRDLPFASTRFIIKLVDRKYVALSPT